MKQTSKLVDKIFFNFESKTSGSSPALLSSVCLYKREFNFFFFSSFTKEFSLAFGFKNQIIIIIITIITIKNKEIKNKGGLTNPGCAL